MMKVMVRDKKVDDDENSENVKRGGGCMTTRERVR